MSPFNVWANLFFGMKNSISCSEWLSRLGRDLEISIPIPCIKQCVGIRLSFHINSVRSTAS